MARGRGQSTPQDEENKKIIASKINYFLDQRGVKKIDLVKATGIPQSTISDYASGKTLPNAGNLQKLADFFGVFKSDIDPRFADDTVIKSLPTPIVEKIAKVSSQLEEPRQQIVLDTASSQLKEQEETQKIKKLEDYRLSDEFLDEQVSKASAYGGKPLSDNDKEFFKQLLKKTMEERIERGE